MQVGFRIRPFFSGAYGMLPYKQNIKYRTNQGIPRAVCP